MPKYEVVFEIRARCWIAAHNEDEAFQIALEDTTRGIGAGIELGDLMGVVDSIRPFKAFIEPNTGEESFQCPNCDTWGYDVKKSFCEICDAEEEEDNDEDA